MINIELNTIDIKEIYFENNMIMGEDLSLNVAEEYNIDVDLQKKSCVGKVSIDIKGNEVKGNEERLKIRVVLNGYFSSEEVLEDKKEVSAVTHSKVFAHAQAIIRSISGIVGIPTIMLPEPNFDGEE